MTSLRYRNYRHYGSSAHEKPFDTLASMGDGLEIATIFGSSDVDDNVDQTDKAR